MNPSIESELHELIENQFDGCLTDAGRHRINELIRDDAEARALYIDQCMLHAMLGWEHGVLPPMPANVHGTSDAERANDPDPVVTGPIPTRHLGMRWPAIAATIMMVMASGWWAYRQRAIQPDEVAYQSTPPIATPPWDSRTAVGRLVRTVGDELRVVDRDVRLSAGEPIRIGDYELRCGLVELNYDNGVEMVIASPARFEVVDAMRINVYQGNVSARVSERAQGFVVWTPAVEVVDHGTEFSVDVRRDESSEVHVFKGNVDVRPLRAPPRTSNVNLTADQATRVDPTGVYPQGVDIAPDRFVRRLGKSDDDGGRFQTLALAMQPSVYMPMGVPDNGYVLRDLSDSGATGGIEPGAMIRPPIGHGYFGSALRLGGPQRRAFAYLDDYPKSTTGQISVSAWVLADSRPRWAAIARHWAVELIDGGPQNAGSGGQFHFGLCKDSGDLEVQIRDRSGTIVQARERTPFPLHRWQHVAFVADGSKLTLYRDGSPVADVPHDGLAVDGPSRLGIGAKLDPTGREADFRNPGFWQGKIDELLIFDRPLSKDEIRKLAQPREAYLR